LSSAQHKKTDKHEFELTGSRSGFVWKAPFITQSTYLNEQRYIN